MGKNSIVFDTNIFIDLYMIKNMSIEKCLKIAKYLYPEDNIQELIVPESVYREIEGIKKGTEIEAQSARKVYADIGKEIMKDSKILKHEEIVRHIDGVDDGLIDFVIENNYLFFTQDIKTYIRYLNRKEIGETPINYTKQFVFKGRLERLYKIISDLECIDNNLSQYIKKIFETNNLDMIDYIKNPIEERCELFLESVINENIKYEEFNNYTKNQFKELLKKQIKKLENIKLSDEDICSALRKFPEYSFGKPKKQTLRERYRDIVDNFLLKNGLTFDNLRKKELFYTEDEIVKKILEKERYGK